MNRAPLRPGDVPKPMTARERRRLADLDAADRDRAINERPNEPPTPLDPDPDSWKSFCAGNRTNRHGWPEAKITNTDLETGAEVKRWRCGSCGRWLRAPTDRPVPR